jgi:hypothetical protein
MPFKLTPKGIKKDSYEPLRKKGLISPIKAYDSELKMGHKKSELKAYDSELKAYDKSYLKAEGEEDFDKVGKVVMLVAPDGKKVRVTKKGGTLTKAGNFVGTVQELMKTGHSLEDVS